MRPGVRGLIGLGIASAVLVAACTPARLPGLELGSELRPQAQGVLTLRGRVEWPPHARSAAPAQRTAAAGLPEVANLATVSLIDAISGDTVSSSVTDAAGNFVLTFSNIPLTSDSPYSLEAVKGLAIGGLPNRPGAGAARIRTMLFWNDGWQSLTNTTQGVGITVSEATTALATLTSLKRTAGVALDLKTLIGTVTGGAFREAGTGLSNLDDFLPVVGLVRNALKLDQDPVGAIGYDKDRNTYQLATSAPLMLSHSPAVPAANGTVTIKGLYFDPNDGRNTFFFGATAASTWSVPPDRTSVTVRVPANAVPGPLTLRQPGGLSSTLTPILPIEKTVGTLAGGGVAADVDGKGTAASFNYPQGLAIDAQNNIYVAEWSGFRVRKVTLDGTVTTLAGGAQGYLNAQGTSAKFDILGGVAVDAGGNVYVADFGNHRIRRIDPAGNVTNLAGNGTPGYADGLAADAQFSSPNSVAVDPSGTNVYVADYGGHRVRQITGGMVRTLAGNGTAGFLDGTGTSAQVSSPTGIGYGPDGNVYLCDNGNKRIRRITTAGVVTTLAGDGTSAHLDGTGSDARFQGCYQMAFDGAGNLIAADYPGPWIRKVTMAGVVTSIAGNGITGFADGAANVGAMFNAPTGIAVDSAGNVMVADFGNHKIRVLTP